MVDVAPCNNSGSPLVPVLGLSFFAVASGFLMSLIPLSLTANGLSSTLSPWLASIFYLGLLIGAFTIQRIVAITGHRIAFMAFLVLLTLTVAVQVAWPGEFIWLAARLVAGIAVAGIFVVVESWLLMTDTAKTRAKRLGLYMTSLYGGTAVGQLAIKPLGVDGALPYLVVIGLLLVAVMVPLLVKTGQPNRHQSEPLRLKELKVLSRPAIMGCLVSGLVLGPIYGLMPLYIARTDYAPNTGLLMAVIILGGMLVQPLVSYLSPRCSKRLLMAGFCAIGGLSVMGIAWAAELSIIMGCYLLLGACSFALYPVAIALACDGLPVTKIVAATEFMLLSYSIGSVAGPLLAANTGIASEGLPVYLAVCLIATSLYMLLSSNRRVPANDTPVTNH